MRACRPAAVPEGMKREITQLGTQLRAIMTQFTSVHRCGKSDGLRRGGRTRIVDVPIAMPEGVQHHGGGNRFWAAAGGVAGV